MSDNLSNIGFDSLGVSLVPSISGGGRVYLNEERAQLVEDLSKMTRNQLLTSFSIRRISNEQKSSIINRIINEINFDEIQQNICDTQEDGKYLLREKCFQSEIPFEDRDNIDVLNEKIKNHVKLNYTIYTHDQLRELGINELKTLMDFHNLKICTYDTVEHLRGILNLFFTEDVPGRTRKMLYEGYIFYDSGFFKSLIDQVNFIISGVKKEYGSITNVRLGKKYKICCENKTAINRWKNREVLDPDVWNIFHRHSNIYATKEGLIFNLSGGNLTPYKGTTVLPKDHDSKKNNYCYIGINGIKYLCHTIIASIYCENKDPIKYKVVDHLDGKKNNNDRTNLEWTDEVGNAGNKHSQHKTTAINQLDDKGEITRRFDSITKAANENGITRKYVRRCCTNRQEYVVKNGIKLRFEYADPKIKHDVSDKSKYYHIGKLFDGHYYDYYVLDDDSPKIISGKSRLELKPHVPIDHEQIGLASNGLITAFYVHQLVYFTLIDRTYVPTEGMVINHINGKKRDNKKENLEWIIEQKNIAYALGKKTYRYRKNEVDNTFVYEMEFDSMREAARSVLHTTRFKENTVSIQIKKSFNFKYEVFGSYWSDIPWEIFMRNSSN